MADRWGPGQRDIQADGRATEAEFLNILKCNSAESASTGFQFNFILFLMTKLLQ